VLPNIQIQLEIRHPGGGAPVLERPDQSIVVPWRRAPVAVLAALTVTIAAIALAISGFQIDPTFGLASSQSTGASYAGVAGPTARIGQEAPAFVLTSLEGPDFDLAADIGQRPIWITFWATWCGPCRAEAPDLEAATRGLEGTDVVHLAVSLGESEAVVRDYVESGGYTWRTLIDPDREAGAAYAVRAFPTHVFIGRDGVVAAIRPGLLNRSQMETFIEKHLQPRPG
jgi:thiol-disulfide isomerase/thioredoxin